MTTKTKLQEIRERREAATPGSWYNSNGTVISRPTLNSIMLVSISVKGRTLDNSNDNAEFIAHAPTDIDYLLRLAECAEEMAKAINNRPDLPGPIFEEMRMVAEEYEKVRDGD